MLHTINQPPMFKDLKQTLKLNSLHEIYPENKT